MRQRTTTSILNDDELAMVADGIRQLVGESVTLAIEAYGLDVEALLRFMQPGTASPFFSSPRSQATEANFAMNFEVYEHKATVHRRLVIEAQPRVDIWLGDNDGHLVQKETQKLDTWLLPGDYVVTFGLGTQTYPIQLSADSFYTQAEIEAGPTCPRPKVKLGPLYTAKQGQYLAFIYYFTKIHGMAPSEADVQRYFRVSPPRVHQMVVTLENRGLIAREPGKGRSIKLLLNRQEIPDLE